MREATDWGCAPLVGWIEGMSANTAPRKESQDRLDAALCLLIAIRWRLGKREQSVAVGDLKNGYIVSPVSEPVFRRLREVAATPGVPINDLWEPAPLGVAPQWRPSPFAIALIGSAHVCAQEVHYSPEERLDVTDVQLISTAKQSVDLASCALTDRSVIEALNAADRRRVVIRIVLDPRKRHDFVALGDLSDNVRIKHGGPFMHLKAYAIDGVLLRTGSANFSTSGENAQDNDLIVIRDAGAAARFDAHFARMWDAAGP